MAYSELIKNFRGIRDYMRQFLVYGFKSREEFHAKSPRSYDNEKRRIESWLSDYMSFRQDANGKAVFLSVDSRRIKSNPLYKAWKASGFTKNDISLHFLLMDILADGSSRTIPEILDSIDTEYLPAFQNAEPPDESILRKKLKEYTELGLITAMKHGKRLKYSLRDNVPNLDSWQDALCFFSEDNSLGVVGSFLLDKFKVSESVFAFKHRYLLFALDSGIMLDLLTAIHEHRKVEIESFYSQGDRYRSSVILPLKIYISVQGGRQYAAACNLRTKKISYFRLDSIQRVKVLDIAEDYGSYQEILEEERGRIWGVATGQRQVEHIEMVLKVVEVDIHIARRLEREKRCGDVTQLDLSTWRFTADVYSARELLPWLRTFIGRIISLSCSNKRVEELFWRDFKSLEAHYAGDIDGLPTDAGQGVSIGVDSIPAVAIAAERGEDNENEDGLIVPAASIAVEHGTDNENAGDDDVI
jgi:hypothetical protein